MNIFNHTDSPLEADRLAALPDYVIEYMAPMQCGKTYRMEAIRRIKERAKEKTLGELVSGS